MAFDVDPHGFVVFEIAADGALHAEGGRVAFFEGVAEEFVDAVEVLVLAFLFVAEEDLVFEFWLPHAGAHVVGHVGEVGDVDAEGFAVAKFALPVARGDIAVFFDEGEDARAVVGAGDGLE